jgi:hypothetical protein
VTDDRLPAQRSKVPATSSGVPVHQPGTLEFVDGDDRVQCWERLSATVRGKVHDLVGERHQWVEWWAENTKGGRVRAVVFGQSALVVLEPTIGASGRPATEISKVWLDAASMQNVKISGSGATTGSPGPRADRAGDLAATSLLSGRLHTDVAGFLGQLPAKAQQLLQEPFIASPAARIDHDFFYFRTGAGHGLSGASLQVWCYLTDRRTLTFCAGVGRGYREPHPPASWALTCWRVDVRRPHP